MKLKDGRITFLFAEEGAFIEIHDNEANVLMCKIKLNPSQVCQMLSRLGRTECELMEVFNLNKIGKKHENKSFEFKLPKVAKWRDKELAIQMIDKICPEGWEADKYFGSQDSFFNKNGVQYARTTIRRWK